MINPGKRGRVCVCFSHGNWGSCASVLFLFVINLFPPAFSISFTLLPYSALNSSNAFTAYDPIHMNQVLISTQAQETLYIFTLSTCNSSSVDWADKCIFFFIVIGCMSVIIIFLTLSCAKDTWVCLWNDWSQHTHPTSLTKESDRVIIATNYWQLYWSSYKVLSTIYSI